MRRSHHIPYDSGKHRAGKRPYHHNPEIAPCVRREQCRTERTRRVDGTVVDRDTYDIDQPEADTDSQTGKVADTEFARSTEDNEHKEECQKYLHKESHGRSGTGLKHIGSKAVAAGCSYTAEIETFAELEKPVKEESADSRADKLGDPVAYQIFGCEVFIGQENTQRHCRIDMAA